MHRAAWLFGILLTLAAVCPGATHSDRERDGLKGPVGMVRVEAARFFDSEGKHTEGSRKRRERRTYDERGNLHHVAFYDGDYVISSRFYFPENGDTQSEVAHIRKSFEAPTGLAAVNGQGVNTLRFKLTHKNDAAGNRIEASTTAEDGTLVRKLIYSYDKAGNLTQVAQYSGDDKLAHKWIYCATSDIKQHDEFSEAGALLSRETYSYEYDAQKNWIKRVSSKPAAGSGRAEPFEVTYRTITYYPPLGDFQANGALVPAGVSQRTERELSSIVGNATKRMEPRYPVAARAAHISGSVVVEVTVDEEGDVLSARAVSGYPLLRGAALDAAWDWKFMPIVYQGRPVKVIGSITFNFNL